MVRVSSVSYSCIEKITVYAPRDRRLWEEMTRLFKHPKLPNNVMVHEFLGLRGKPDAVVIFEAPDAATAADVLVQFSRVTEATTSLALPIEEFKWTR